MVNSPKILALAGSLREDSFNKKLVKIAVAGARKVGAEVTIVDLSDYRMPIYDGDFESKEGLPAEAKELRQLFIDHDGFLIASPEYNSSITGVLKNTIDWVSRTDDDCPEPLKAFRGKVAAIMSASPGGLGGIRGLVHLRSILSNIGVLVLPNQVTVSGAGVAFNEDGQLKDPVRLKKVLELGSTLSEVISKLHSS